MRHKCILLGEYIKHIYIQYTHSDSSRSCLLACRVLALSLTLWATNSKRLGVTKCFVQCRSEHFVVAFRSDVRRLCVSNHHISYSIFIVVVNTSKQLSCQLTFSTPNRLDNEQKITTRHKCYTFSIIKCRVAYDSIIYN